ncbi:MAG: GtrA family protein [Tumebacillaceae bacterium]
MIAVLNHSFTRFLLVGVLNTLVGLSSIYLLLHLIGLPYWPATFFGNGIGAACSYVLNKRFTFHSSVPLGRSMWKFALVTLVCYFLSYWIGELLTAALPKGWAENVAVLVGSVFYTVLNYLGHRYFTFQ